MLQKWNENRTAFFACQRAAFLWGLIAHAYMFMHSAFTHDALNEFNAALFGNELKIQAGRIFVPAYRAVMRSELTLPWLIGVLSLFYIGTAVFLTAKIFDMRPGCMTALTAGIFCANLTVATTAASYIHDLDCNMLALLLSVFAVYLWERGHALCGTVPVALSLGLYQSYISVTVVLVIFSLMLALLHGEEFKPVFTRGLRSVGMLLGGGLLYIAAIKGVCALTGVALHSGNYNSLDRCLSMSLPEWGAAIEYGYLKAIQDILRARSVYPAGIVFAVHILLLCFVCAVLLLRLVSVKRRYPEKALLLALFAVLPLGMNISDILLGGYGHAVMHFAFWLFYLLVLLLARYAKERLRRTNAAVRRCVKILPAALVLVILWGNVQLSNAMYLQKDIISRANQQLFTRVIDDMERVEGYVSGETPVVFAGAPALEKLPGFEAFSSFPHALGAAGRTYYQAYLDYVMLDSAVTAEEETWEAMQRNETVLSMPAYPQEGSICIVDDVLIVKLS